MEEICSYGDCRGSPKNSCSCDHSLKFCEYHIQNHLKQLGDHSLRPLGLSKEPTSSLLAHEMKNLSSTMSKVMQTGKGMFQEICRKLCEITEELTVRQDKLIEMASNLSKTQDLPQESFKELGDLGLNFKSNDEFGKLVDEHFSKSNATVDFSIFSDEIKNIMNHLAKSNQLLEEVRNQSKDDLDHRKALEDKVNQIESSAAQMKQDFAADIKKLQDHSKMVDARYALKDQTQSIQESISTIEKNIEQHEQLIFDVNNKYVSISGGMDAQEQMNQINNKKIEEFKKKVEEQIKVELHKFTKIVNDNVAAINKTIANNTNILNDGSDKKSKELKALLDAKVANTEKDFKTSCDEINTKIQAFDSDLQKFKNYMTENDKFKKEITDKVIREMEERKKKEADDLKRKQEEELKRKQEEEIKRKQDEERQRQEAEARRIKEENDKKEREEAERRRPITGFVY